MNITTDSQRPQGLARRAFVAGLAAVIPTAAASTVTASPLGDDEKLIELARQIYELQQQMTSGCCTETHKVFEEIRPAVPSALHWKIDDPVRHSCRQAIVDGKCFMICDFVDIDAKRDKQFFRHWYVGTDADSERLGLEGGWIPEAPVVGYEHLWQISPDKKTQARMARLVEARDAFVAAEQAAYRDSGFKAAEDERDALFERQRSVLEAMMEMRPTTLEGYRALASAVVWCCWSGYIEEGDTYDEMVLARMCSHLTAIPMQNTA